MTDYTWTGAVSTDSNTAGNWNPAAVPTATDSAIFDNTSSVDCVWTLTQITNITHNATAHSLIFDLPNLEISGVFHFDGNLAVGGSQSSLLVKFTGSGETLITFQNETLWVNGDTDKAKTTFEILGTGNNIMFQNGEYPIVKIGTGTTVSPHVPNAASNTYTETDFYQLTFATTGKFAETSAVVYSSDPKEERNKVFRVRSIGTWSPERFEGGKATWIFYATTAGFELPLSGSNISTATSFEGKVAQIKVVATTIGQKIKIPPGPHYMEKLTIDVGVMCLCDRSIAELHMTNRPTIDGAWQFVQITDGIYRSAKEDMILPISHGGTGQRDAQSAINALSQVSAATNEHVLTKDTSTGNAVWKAGGSGATVDAASVQAAGALMDSEVANLAAVKAFDPAAFATAAQGALADTSLQDPAAFATAAQGVKADSAQQPPSEGPFVNGDKTKLDSLASPFEHVRLALTNNSLPTQTSGTNYYLELANTGHFSNTGNTTNIVATNDTQDYVLLKAGGMYLVVVSVEMFTSSGTAAQDFWLQLGNGVSSNAERRNWGTARRKVKATNVNADCAWNAQKSVVIDVPSSGSDEYLYVIPYVNGVSFTVRAFDNNRTNITIT